MRKVVKVCVVLLLFINFIFINTYKVEAKEGNTVLKDTILKENILKYTTDENTNGLYYLEHENDKIYFYRGEVNNNNLVFNGLKFNILGIDINGNVRIMLNEDELKAISSNYKEVLNNWYIEKFDESDTKDIITKTVACDNLSNNMFCTNMEEVDVSLVTLQEYKHSKINNNTFLNKEYNYYFWTTYYNHKYYFDAINSEIHTTKLKEFNIYPVITLSSKAIISSGDGTSINPYIIANTIYGNSENTIKEDRTVKLDNPKIIKKDDITLLIDDNNLNSITYEIYNGDIMPYSIKFLKESLKSVQEYNLEIKLNEIDDTIFKNIDNILSKHIYKTFNVTNLTEFPTTAITKIKVDDKYNDGNALWLYYYNSDTKKLEYADNNLIVEDSYVTLNINKGGQYVLTDKEIKNFKNNIDIKKYIIFSISILCLIAIFSLILIKKDKKR